MTKIVLIIHQSIFKTIYLWFIHGYLMHKKRLIFYQCKCWLWHISIFIIVFSKILFKNMFVDFIIHDYISLKSFFNESIEILLKRLRRVDVHRLPISLDQQTYLRLKFLYAQPTFFVEVVHRYWWWWIAVAFFVDTKELTSIHMKFCMEIFVFVFCRLYSLFFFLYYLLLLVWINWNSR